MPYRVHYDNFDDPVLFWWLDKTTLKDEVDQFPWLKWPHAEHDVGTSSSQSDKPSLLIKNPTYAGELCSVCRHLDFEWLATCNSYRDGVVIDDYQFTGIDIGIHYLTVSNAKRGRAIGCPSCAITLWALCNDLQIDDVPEFASFESDDKPTKWLSWLPWSRKRSRKSPLWFGIRSLGGHNYTFSPALSTETDHGVDFDLTKHNAHLQVVSRLVADPWNKFKTADYVPVPGGDGTCADLSAVRSLLDECRQHIGDHADINNEHLHLKDESNSQQTYFIDVLQECLEAGTTYQIEYVALSYVWGSASSIELTTKTLKEFLRPGFLKSKLSSVPLTIRDAMVACRKLGFRYLWVDRLCLVQDSSSKQDLIRNMHIVYASAVVTLVAAAGEDANGGLPGVRVGSRNKNHATAVANSGLCLASTLRPGDAAKTWNTRAWTLQERLCSQRLLYFGAEQLHLACPHMERNEEDFLNVRSGKTVGSYSYDKNEIAKYCRLVSDYTARHLTNDSDIYDAFAGSLALISQKFHNPIFVNAIPVAFLDHILLFKLDTPATRRTVRSQGGTPTWPTWSWLGWKGKATIVHEDRFDQIPCIKWMPDVNIMTRVEDTLLVQAQSSITPQDFSNATLEERFQLQEKFMKIRYGHKQPTFENIMLSKLHLEADVAFFWIGKEDPTYESRFQILDLDRMACGIVYLHCETPKDLCRFVKIAIGKAESVTVVSDSNIEPLDHYDTDKYKPVDDESGEFSIYKVLAVNERNERLGNGSIHVGAFDAMCEKNVDIVLV